MPIKSISIPGCNIPKVKKFKGGVRHCICPSKHDTSSFRVEHVLRHILAMFQIAHYAFYTIMVYDYIYFGT